MSASENPLTLELRRLMKRHKLNQTGVAEIAGCRRNTVHYWLKEAPVIPEHRLRVIRFELKNKR